VIECFIADSHTRHVSYQKDSIRLGYNYRGQFIIENVQKTQC